MIEVCTNGRPGDARAELLVDSRESEGGEHVEAVLVLRRGRVERVVDVEGRGDEELVSLDEAADALEVTDAELRERVVRAFPLAERWRWAATPRP